jgi:hypothetical protein
MAVVLWLIGWPRFDADVPMLVIFGVAFAAVLAIARLMVVSQITRAATRNVALKDPPPSTEARSALWLGLFTTRLIIGLALLEGAAFFNLVMLLLEEHALGLCVALLLVLGMLLHFPTSARLQAFVAGRERAAEEMRQLALTRQTRS